MNRIDSGSSSTETEPETLEATHGQGAPPLALIVIFHPDLERVGDRAFLGLLPAGEKVLVGRREPLFAPPRRGQLRGLGDRRLSRRGLELRGLDGGGVEIDAGAWSNSLHVGRRQLEGTVELSAEALERGVSLMLSRRVVLWLHRRETEADLTDGLGLVGESAGLVRLRNEIPAVAKASFPVLIRGETGTGKELVAQAIASHPANPRRSVPLVVRNMATIPRELAAAELFGAAAGAYSGQKGERRGAFREAHGGTLFLDEIGDTVPEVQPMLLRALESGEVVPLGQEKAERVDVRVLAATDLDLEDAVVSQRFRSPLRHRLAGYEIRIPPLRARKDDLGRLLVHFLRAGFDEVGELHRFEANRHAFPWLP
ncbi:MAG: sigma 54-interacting transcriptional regulator, partial [Acidobacteriota bacterium]